MLILYTWIRIGEAGLNLVVTNYSAEVWCSVGQWMWIETVVHNVLINKPECVHYDDVVVNEII